MMFSTFFTYLPTPNKTSTNAALRTSRNIAYTENAPTPLVVSLAIATPDTQDLNAESVSYSPTTRNTLSVSLY